MDLEERNGAIVRAYFQRRPKDEIMRQFKVSKTRTREIIIRHLRRLRERGLHQQLEAAGCPLTCLRNGRTPEYLALFEESQRYLSTAQVEEAWFQGVVYRVRV